RSAPKRSQDPAFCTVTADPAPSPERRSTCSTASAATTRPGEAASNTPAIASKLAPTGML
ncbi:hypothetical protein NTG44_04380, partial [Pseudomonas sp. 20P_3.2_Bac4]|nr:hypothetical protein [Pseudomonas sp. 20P_3.2_Bac4]